MNKKFIFNCLTIVLLAISCNHVYKEYDKESFPTYVWKVGQEITFTPVIKDVNKSYALILGIRHLYGFQFSSVTVTVKSISPSGREATTTYALRIKDAGGKYIGKCGGDLCDLETVVDGNVKFEEAGQYKYIVTHNVQADRVSGVMEFGLIIDEKE